MDLGRYLKRKGEQLMDELLIALTKIADLTYCETNGCANSDITAEDCRKCVAKVAEMALEKHAESVEGR
jgi:hypothetical protein